MGHGPHHVGVPQVDNPLVRSDLSRLLGLAYATRRIVASHRLIFGESTSGESKNERRTNSMPAFVFATRNGFCCTALRGQQRWGGSAGRCRQRCIDPTPPNASDGPSRQPALEQDHLCVGWQSPGRTWPSKLNAISEMMWCTRRQSTNGIRARPPLFFPSRVLSPNAITTPS
jgi:hypothetical protein